MAEVSWKIGGRRHILVVNFSSHSALVWAFCVWLRVIMSYLWIKAGFVDIWAVLAVKTSVWNVDGASFSVERSDRASVFGVRSHGAELRAAEAAQLRASSARRSLTLVSQSVVRRTVYFFPRFFLIFTSPFFRLFTSVCSQSDFFFVAAVPDWCCEVTTSNHLFFVLF